MRQRLTIRHRPTGTDAPYFAGPDERTPRDPIGGDMVGIGFLTQPGGAATDVRLCWTRNGRPQTLIQGRPVAQGNDADRWLCELGVIEAGDQVDYWIVATGNDDRTQSDLFTFAARRWRTLGAIIGASPQRDGWTLATRAADGAAGPTLQVTILDGSQGFRCTVGAAGTADGRTEQPIQLRAETATLTIDPDTARVVLVSGDQQIPLAIRWLEDGDGALAAVELVGEIASHEALVGFGERFDALDQRGRALDIAVWEQYKNQGNRTYLPVPFFCSSRGYGCLIEGSAHVAYDIGRTMHDRWRCVAQTDHRRELRFDLFCGQPAAIVQQLTALSGRPATLPDWAFGPWMSSNEWNTQARVEREVQLTIEHDIPATALVIEAWSDETTFYIWNGAQYTPRAGGDRPQLTDFHFPADGPWPDPKAMCDQLRQAGIHLLLWQIPVLKRTDAPHPQHDVDIAHALEQRFVIHHSDETPYRNPAFWFNGALIPDFTDQAATRWWLDKRAYLVDEIGIDGFKTDGGEHLQGRDLRASNGQQGDALVNSYPNAYIGAYYRFIHERRGGITFSRAGHTGVGAFPAHWAGDENSTWEAYRRSIVAGLSAAMSGVIFWGWDIAGFSETLPSAELYLRATAMATFCPIMQYHSEYTPPGEPSNDRTPWNIAAHTGNPQVIPIYRAFAKLRMRLLPYIRAEAAYCAARGEPLLRPLLLDNPDDAVAWRINDQFRFGRYLLVAPVVEADATTRRLYLPAGNWRDLWDGTQVAGAGWVTVHAPIERIPVFICADSDFALDETPN